MARRVVRDSGGDTGAPVDNGAKGIEQHGANIASRRRGPELHTSHGRPFDSNVRRGMRIVPSCNAVGESNGPPVGERLIQYRE